MDIVSQAFSFFFSNVLPSGLIMFIGWLLLFLSHGGGATKVDSNSTNAKKYQRWGKLFLFTGFFGTILVVIFQTWDSYTSQVESITSFILLNVKDIFLIIKTPQILYISGIISLIIIGAFYFRKKRVENEYKIKMIGVIKSDNDSRSNFREAKIQVERIGTNDFICAARLVSVKHKISGGKEYVSIPVEKLNPDGKYLIWSSNRAGYQRLSGKVPDTVILLQSYREGVTYGKRMVFVFFDDHSETIEYGDYKIKVDFVRLENRTKEYKKFCDFEGTLRVKYDDLEWIEKKEM